MNAFELIDIAFTALERRKDPPVPSTGRKSYMTSQAQKDPNADLGTGEVGTLRYFTVKAERGKFVFYVDVQAANTWEAGKIAFEQNPGSLSVQVCREIDRTEYERLKRHR